MRAGLKWRVLKRGPRTIPAIHPTYSDRVVVKYSGWTPDGNMFDSSFRHSRDGSGTMSFRLNQVISGW